LRKKRFLISKVGTTKKRTKKEIISSPLNHFNNDIHILKELNKIIPKATREVHALEQQKLTEKIKGLTKHDKKEYQRYMHWKKSLSEGFANRPIERYHNEVRAVIKSKRGLGNDKSTQEFADGYRIYHNYCRPHAGLPDKKTPAEAAGLDLNLGENKIRDLIVKSTTPNNFAIQLGLRIDRVIIVNEKDSIKVSPKKWIEKQTWREINDILRLNGFSWLSNGKDSCWMKLLS